MPLVLISRYVCSVCVVTALGVWETQVKGDSQFPCKCSSFFDERLMNLMCCILHLCPGFNAVTNFANFMIFRFSFKFNKFCDFSLNCTRYTKISCLTNFCTLCRNLQFYANQPASAGLRILQNLLNLRFFANFTIFQ